MQRTKSAGRLSYERFSGPRLRLHITWRAPDYSDKLLRQQARYEQRATRNVYGQRLRLLRMDLEATGKLPLGVEHNGHRAAERAERSGLRGIVRAEYFTKHFAEFRAQLVLQLIFSECAGWVVAGLEITQRTAPHPSS